MARIVGAVDDPRFLAAVVGKPLLDVKDAERLLPGCDEGDLLTFADRVGGPAPDGEGDRQGPGQPVREAHPMQDGPVVLLAHESLERAVGAHGEQLEIGHHPGVERDALQRTDALARVTERVAAQDPVGQPSAVGRDLDVHDLYPGRTLPGPAPVVDRQ